MVAAEQGSVNLNGADVRPIENPGRRFTVSVFVG